jgi:AraC-like DNA-binding protein
MQITRHTLFATDLLEIGHVAAKATSPGCGPVERQPCNVLVLPLQGVFAKHEGPRRHVIATPNHAVFLAAGHPYRISLPGGIGDRCLTLRLTGEILARTLPHAAACGRFDTAAFASDVLLTPKAMLARSVLWHRLSRGDIDALEVEELSFALLGAALHAADRRHHRTRRKSLRERAAPRVRHLERVKEAISLQPERKWTLSELAELACVTPFHLAHVFRQEVGESAYRYVLRARLARALEAVLGADRQLTEIALDNGFTSHSHFTARFRALFGLTPLEVRRGASGKLAEGLRKIVTARAAVAA